MSRPTDTRFTSVETGGGELLVTGAMKDSPVQVGDIIVSVNGKRFLGLKDELQDPGERRLEVIDVHTGKLRALTSKRQEPEDAGTHPVFSNVLLALFYLISGIARRAKSSSDDPASEKIHALLRQRRILADHLRGYILSKRALEDLIDGLLNEQQARHQREISELNDRLAATAEALGAEKAERILEGVARVALSERLKQEQETTARLDSVVRRLAARPRIKRGTTHVEIGGTVYRNRTLAKGVRS